MFFRSDFRLVIRYIVGNLVHRSIFNLCVGHLFTFLLHFLSHIFSGSYVFSVLPMCWFKFICIGFSHSLIGMCYIYFACLYCLTQIPNLFSKYSKFCINISETISEEQRIFFSCISLVSSSFLSIVIHFNKKRVFVAHNFFFDDFHSCNQLRHCEMLKRKRHLIGFRFWFFRHMIWLVLLLLFF